MIPDYQANDARQKWEPTNSGEIAPNLDDLESRVRDVTARIDAALAEGPEPVDWHAHYRDLLATYEGIYRRLGPQDGGA